MPTTSHPLIRAVIWDFGGVLVRTEDPEPRRDLERRHGLRPGELEALFFRSEAGQAGALGRRSEDDVWRWVCTVLGLPETRWQTLQTEFFAGDRLDEELIAFVRRLRPRYRTGLLSNAFGSLRPALSDLYPIADAFDATVISAEEGVAKPDPRIYRTILARLGSAPEEALFVDDFDENCEAARALGMQAVAFTTAAETMTQVRRLLG